MNSALPLATRILLNGLKIKGFYSRFKLITMANVSTPCSAVGISYHLHRVPVTQQSIVTPGQTVDFQLSVLDTHPGDTQHPIVVGIPGIPGWALDFEPLIQQLSDRNIRFIGPTFPGFQTSEVDPWKLYHLDYSSLGRQDIVEQILKHLGVNRVTMLMCHSAGAWVGYKMAAESDWVQSLCVFNPGCARPHKSLRPQWVIHGISRMMRMQSLHFFLMPFLEFAYSWIGFQGVKAGDHLMVSQQIVSSQNFEDTKVHAAKILQKRLPLLFAYSLNDKIIEVPVSEEMLFQHLHVPRHRVTCVDADKKQTQLEKKGVESSVDEVMPWAAYGLRFERGGHVVHKAYSDIIIDRVMQILSHVKG